jgi:tetratricopeptide (TPR) repeat protein
MQPHLTVTDIGETVDEGHEVAQKAHAYARRAGQEAAASLAYEEASRLYRMALAVLDVSGSTDDAARVELLLKTGEVEARAGDVDGSRASFLRAATIARRLGHALDLARAALGYGGRLVWARAGGDRRLVPLLQEALVLLGGENDELRARLLTRLACAMRSEADQREQCDALSRQAVEIARRADDPTTLAWTLIGRFWATWWPENPDDRRALANEVARAAQRWGDGELLIDEKLLSFITLTESGELDEGRRMQDEVRRMAEDLRQPAHIWLGSVGPAMMALVVGDLARASVLIEQEGETAHGTTFARDDISSYRMHRFLLAREKGALEAVEPLTRAAADEFPWYPSHRAALALLLIELGRRDEARAIVAELARGEFEAFNRDNQWLLGMSMASEACALLEEQTAAAVLYGQLLPFAGRFVIGHAEGALGVVDRYLGLLAETIGRSDDAERHLYEAVRLNEKTGARPWAAHAGADLARLLRARAIPGDVDRARELERAALATARALGMTALATRLDDFDVEPQDGEPSSAGPEAAPPATFQREGEYWTIVFASDSFRLRDSKGLGYLARMLDEPGREFLALDLAAGATDAVSSSGRAEGLRRRDLGDAGAMLDDEAKSAYRSRLHDLQEEVTDAQSMGDAERAENARTEMEFLSRELARAVGLGGRDRIAGSASERARLSVTRAIRLALAKIEENSVALGEHLESTIRTGTYCSYRPDARVEIRWST